MKLEDLAGKRFGKLTAIELADPIYHTNGSPITRWRCICTCGRERIVRAAELKRGSTTYCGKCTPPPWLGAAHRKCSHCEFSVWDEAGKDWNCKKGKDTSVVGSHCKLYWCSRADKLNGTLHREGHCIVCGKPTYSYGNDTPIYCLRHRDHAKQDLGAIKNAPKECVFELIAAIFLRAREDYLNNSDNQASDAEVFLRSAWAQELSLGEFDAEEVLAQLDQERKNIERPWDTV